MAYADRTSASRQLPSIAGVVVVHALIGYAFISGLASKVVKETIPIFTVDSIAEPPPPPLNKLEPTKPKPEAEPRPEQASSVDRVVEVPLRTGGDMIVPLPPLPPVALDPPVRESVSPPPPLPSKAAPARVASNRAAWITNDDYPSAALRAEEQGTVAIAVQVGADGRVTSCTVTTSSGHPTLDATTCRLYTRRARFTPALDAEGMPIASSYADRVRWELPVE